MVASHGRRIVASCRPFLPKKIRAPWRVESGSGALCGVGAGSEGGGLRAGGQLPRAVDAIPPPRMTYTALPTKQLRSRFGVRALVHRAPVFRDELFVVRCVGDVRQKVIRAGFRRVLSNNIRSYKIAGCSGRLVQLCHAATDLERSDCIFRRCRCPIRGASFPHMLDMFRACEPSCERANRS